MKKAITRSVGAAGAILLAATALAACSSGPTDAGATTAPSESAASEMVEAEVVVATGPTLSNASTYIGQSEGIFEENGLTVTNQTLTAGPDAIPQLLSGAWTFAAVDTATAIKAAEEGVGVVAVAPVQVGVAGDEGYAAIMTTADSGIEEISDLEGKKMQVNALGGTAEALVRASMEAAGADPDKVQFVEVAPPQAIPAIQAGQVDALFLSEPLISVALGLGLVDIANPEAETIAGLPAFVFLASKQYVAENPQVVRQFQTAILEANALANSDHDLVVETGKTSTTVDPAILSQVTRFPSFGEEPLTAEQVQEFIDFLIANGLLDESDAPAAEDIVADLG